MTGQPLVSVVILHYQRADALQQTLASVHRQSYPNREVIVVANGPQQGIEALLAGEAPEARLLQLESNAGACGGRNAGIRAARGDIIVSLDNDIAFEAPCAIELIVDAFRRRADAHVLAFRVCDGETGALLVRAWCHPRDWKVFSGREFETDHFNEGACAVRREVYERAGLFYEPLFFGAEGWDLVLRMFEQGFRIVYQPGIRVRHMTEEETRPSDRPFYFYTRAYLWTAAKDYPLIAGLRFLGVKLSMMLYLAMRTGHLRAYGRGLRDGVAGIPAVLRDRSAVCRSTLRYVRRLERSRPSLRTRWERHREAVQL